MLKTPAYDLKNFPDVYEPSEDTFLLLDALESEIDFVKHVNPQLLVEIGSGSGVVITALAKALQMMTYCLASDVNNSACSATLQTSKLNGVVVECVNMNLLGSFKTGMFDVIVFNPPYVVTVPEEIAGNGLSRAWAGGRKGREIIDKFLLKLPSLLSESGVCYLLVIKENLPDEVMDVMRNLGFHACIVKERKILGEHLYVLRFCKIY